MKRCQSLVGVLLAAMAAGAPSLAVAAVEPLVVVVETRPGAAVDPAEVRQAIAAELRTLVRAPRDAAAEDTSNLLIVAVDRAEIRMSLRAHTPSVVSRVVAAPGDRKARLQSIGWLAGNLARDQVSPMVVAPVPAPLAVAAASVDTPPAAAEAPPPAPPPPTEPPPLAASAPRDPAPGAIVAAQPELAAASDPTWSLTIGGGPTAFWTGGPEYDLPTWPGVGIWYLELQRKAPSRALILGATLEVGPDMADTSAKSFIGVAALVGAGHRFGRIFLEATGGLGLEVYQGDVPVNMTTTTPTGTETVSQFVPVSVFGLYLRAQATAGVSLSRHFDLLASAGGHQGTAWARRDHFVTTSLGLRVRFE
jgi:hypothetical protein